MAGFYSFIRGIPGKLGVGVADQGFIRSQSLPNYDGIGRERMVQRSLAPLKPSFAILDQTVPTVGLGGLTGSNPHGVPLLVRLAQKAKG